MSLLLAPAIVACALSSRCAPLLDPPLCFLTLGLYIVACAVWDR
jgi:hypothetical protein